VRTSRREKDNSYFQSPQYWVGSTKYSLCDCAILPCGRTAPRNFHTVSIREFFLCENSTTKSPREKDIIWNRSKRANCGCFPHCCRKLITCKYQHKPPARPYITQNNNFAFLLFYPSPTPLPSNPSGRLFFTFLPHLFPCAEAFQAYAFVPWWCSHHSSLLFPHVRDSFYTFGTSPSYRIQRTEISDRLFSHLGPLSPCAIHALLVLDQLVLLTYKVTRGRTIPLGICSDFTFVLRIPISLRDTTCRRPDVV